MTLRLRDMILGGEFQPGERIPEVAVAKELNVSRTPVRWALSVLETEGLVQGIPNRGFRLRRFQMDDVMSAFEVRGALEGLACRLAAEKGLSAETIAEFDACLAEGEALLQVGKLDEHEVKLWSSMNERFHRALLDAAGSPALEAAYDAVARYPAAAPGAIMFTTKRLSSSFRAMRRAHDEHTVLVEALKAGQGGRAEYLAREHTYQAAANMRMKLEADKAQAEGSPASPSNEADASGGRRTRRSAENEDRSGNDVPAQRTG